jgi:uncharacterized phage-associated protein
MLTPFRFNVEKTIQAVAFLLAQEKSRGMEYVRLLKLLYIAEREAIAESGAPITGSTVAAMEHGPVLEGVYDLIRLRHHENDTWDKFFSVLPDYWLQMHGDPGRGKLSKYVVHKLLEVTERHRNHGTWEMVDITHKLPEWEKNNPGTSSKVIPFDDLLAAIGRLQDAEVIREAAIIESRAAKFFSEAS